MSAAGIKKVAPVTVEARATFQETKETHESDSHYTLSPDASLEILREAQELVRQIMAAIARMQAAAGWAMRS